MDNNKPIGADLEGNAPYNEEEQEVTPQKCYYCNEMADNCHVDKDGNEICLDCVQIELENNPEFYFE